MLKFSSPLVIWYKTEAWSPTVGSSASTAVKWMTVVPVEKPECCHVSPYEGRWGGQAEPFLRSLCGDEAWLWEFYKEVGNTGETQRG